MNSYRMLRRNVADEIRREFEREESYKCLCCQDRGYLTVWTVRTYVPGYEDYQPYDPPVVCNRCGASSDYLLGGGLKVPALDACDRQISADDCEEIHQAELERLQEQTRQRRPAEVRHAVSTAQIAKPMPTKGAA